MMHVMEIRALSQYAMHFLEGLRNRSESSTASALLLPSCPSRSLEVSRDGQGNRRQLSAGGKGFPPLNISANVLFRRLLEKEGV